MMLPQTVGFCNSPTRCQQKKLGLTLLAEHSALLLLGHMGVRITEVSRICGPGILNPNTKRGAKRES